MVGSLLPAAIDHSIQNLICHVIKGLKRSKGSTETRRAFSACEAMAADCHCVQR